MINFSFMYDFRITGTLTSDFQKKGLWNTMYKFITDPEQIENKSMEIIAEILGEHNFSAGEESVIKRIVHTTADPEYASLTCFSPGALEAASGALHQSPCQLVTDTQMIAAGINKSLLERCSGSVNCFVGDEEVRLEATGEGITRSMAAVRKAAGMFPRGIYIIGNAPTALFELLQLVEKGQLAPALVIGVPVGFVGAAESKEALEASNLPYITVRGRKGGSTVAVAITNALLKLYATK